MAFAPDYGLVADLEQCRSLFAHLVEQQRPVGFDIETGYSGEPKYKCQLHPEDPASFIVGMSLTNSLTWARYIPLAHDGHPNLGNREVAELLWPLARAGLLTAWNGDFELRWVSRWFTEYLSDHPEFGPEVRAAHLGNPTFPGYFPLLSDPMLETHAEGRSRVLKLKPCTEATFGYKMVEIDELFALPKGKPLTKRELDAIRFNVLDLMGEHRQDVIDYACADALWELAHHLKRYYTRPGSLGLSDPAHPQHFIYRLEMAVQPIGCAMEDEGIELDWGYMRDGEVRAALFQDKLAAEIQADFTRLLNERGIPGPCTVNLNSPQQKAKLLYEQLGLPVPRRTKKTEKGGGGNPSVDAIALEALRKEMPVIQKMLNHAALGTLINNYLAKYPQRYTYAPDGRTHPNWMQHGVPGGRWACSEWQVQSAPKKYHYELDTGEAFDYDFRYGVMCPEGWYWLGFDYAQQERRVLAAEAREPALMDAFNKGLDIHKVTAAGLFGIPVEEVTDEQRPIGKQLGFAMDYGLAPDGLADRLGISVEAAEGLYARYFEAYPRLKPYTEGVMAQARRDGYIVTNFGRRIPIWGYESQRTSADADRVAGNQVIQGPGTGDYPKIAMVRQREALQRAGLLESVRLIINMHDALGWYVRKDVAPLTAIRVLQPAVVFTMPCIAHWPPIVAEWHMGERWGTVRELDVTLDKAGIPVSVRPKLRKAPAPVQAAVATPVAAPVVTVQLPAPAAPETAEVVPVPGVPAVIVVRVAAAPDLEAVQRLVKLARSRPGPNTVKLMLPGEEAVVVAEGSGFTPAQWAEAELLLGVDTEVTAATPESV